MNFLDDDDVLFADHVEALVKRRGAPRQGRLRLRVGDAHTRDRRRACDLRRDAQRPAPPRQFDRLALWHQNFLPDPGRALPPQPLGALRRFAEDMDQLEDWNLWTRYTIEDEFVPVEKTTSKYRVPDDPRAAAARQEKLDAAYADAIAAPAAAAPHAFTARDRADGRDLLARAGVVHATRNAMRQIATSNRVFARVASWRAPTRAWFRRRGL
jgi:hypothetical protein